VRDVSNKYMNTRAWSKQQSCDYTYVKCLNTEPSLSTVKDCVRRKQKKLGCRAVNGVQGDAGLGMQGCDWMVVVFSPLLMCKHNHMSHFTPSCGVLAITHVQT